MKLPDHDRAQAIFRRMSRQRRDRMAVSESSGVKHYGPGWSVSDILDLSRIDIQRRTVDVMSHADGVHMVYIRVASGLIAETPEEQISFTIWDLAGVDPAKERPTRRVMDYPKIDHWMHVLAGDDLAQIWVQPPDINSPLFLFRAFCNYSWETISPAGQTRLDLRAKRLFPYGELKEFLRDWKEPPAEAYEQVEVEVKPK